MKIRMKKTLAVLLVAITTSALLCGCEKESFSSVVEQQEPTKIMLSWWGNDARHIYTMTGVDAFQKEHTDIEVEYRYGEWNGFERRNKVWMEAGTEADIMQINFAWLNQYSPKGDGFYDLYQLSDDIALDNYDEGDLAFGEVNGKLNAIPIAYNTAVMYHNTGIYDQYGLAYPKTFEDYVKAAEVMEPDGIYPLGLVKKQLFLFLLAYYEQLHGHAFFSESGELVATQDEIEEVLSFYCELIDKHVLVPIEQYDQEMFITGKVASSTCWISDAGNYCTNATEQGQTLLLGDYPRMADAKASGQYIKPATMFAISKNTEHPEEAGQLLNYLLNNEEMALLQGTEKGVPVSKSAYQCLLEKDALNVWQAEATEKMMAERDQMHIMIPAMENEAIIDIFKSGADECFYGKMDVSAAAKLIYDEMQAYLKPAEE